MSAQQTTPTSAQPASTLDALREQMKVVQVSLDDALARRAGIQARIDAAGGPGERVALRNGELRGVEGQITRFRQELAGLEAELQVREAALANAPAQPIIAPPVSPAPTPIVAPPVPTIPATAVPQGAGIDLTSAALGGLAMTLLLVPLLLAVAWRAGRRAALADRRTGLGEGGAQLARLEDAITAIQLDVERVSESQRFLTNALVSEGMRAPAREEIGPRR